MHRKVLVNTKPAYYRGQLLLEDDFIAEQHYHANARALHTLNLHGWGVVRGLEVRHAEPNELIVSPGYAIDGHGHEIELRHEEKLELPANAPNAVLAVSIAYAEKDGDIDDDRRTRKCFAILDVAVGVAEASVVLASVEMDEHSRIKPRGVTHANRRELKTVLPADCVTARALEPRLRTGWCRLQFRPTPLPDDEDDFRPPFRVGPTEARAHRDIGEKKNTRGAGGTMGIPLMPGTTRVLKLRVAGEENEGRLIVELCIGGWNIHQQKHAFDRVLREEVKSGGAYDRTWEVSKGDIHLSTSTLSVVLRADAYVRVSLIAVQLTCDPAMLHSPLDQD